MNLDGDVKKLAMSVTCGCSILCVIEIVLVSLLAATGLVTFNPLIIASSIGGTLVIVLCFWWMAKSIQKALDEATKEGKNINAGVAKGYNQRLFAQAIWIVLDIFVPKMIYGDFVPLITICGLLPLLFPRISILVSQAKGKLKKNKNISSEEGGEE